MNILFRISMMFLMCLSMVVIVSCDSDNDSNADIDDIIIEELERRSITASSLLEVFETDLPNDLDKQADWGVPAVVCAEGGYDLYPYEGETVTVTRYDVRGDCSEEAFRVSIISKNDAIACIYCTAIEEGGMVPGIWAIEDNCSGEGKAP